MLGEFEVGVEGQHMSCHRVRHLTVDSGREAMTIALLVVGCFFFSASAVARIATLPLVHFLTRRRVAARMRSSRITSTGRGHRALRCSGNRVDTYELPDHAHS